MHIPPVSSDDCTSFTSALTSTCASVPLQVTPGVSPGVVMDWWQSAAAADEEEDNELLCDGSGSRDNVPTSILTLSTHRQPQTLNSTSGGADWKTEIFGSFSATMFVFSSLSGHAPPYLANDMHLVSKGRWQRLRSSTDRSCAVPRTRNTFGNRSFAVAWSCVWNSLPAHLRNEDITYNSFRRELKTFCFNVASGVQCDFC